MDALAAAPTFSFHPTKRAAEDALDGVGLRMAERAPFIKRLDFIPMRGAAKVTVFAVLRDEFSAYTFTVAAAAEAYAPFGR